MNCRRVVFMDWDLKLTHLDFAGLEQGRNCSVDLKIGGSGASEPSNQWKDQQAPGAATAASMVSSSFSGSSKRARAASNGGPIASCLVDGCVSDLSKCREYHRRHKVCEAHSKTAIVMVGGREQRFCQQCSRFHLLVEFDDVKRSCRKRLEGHNRRRRKPQLLSLNSGAFMTNHQGTRFTSYPQIFSITTAKSNWAPIFKAEEVPLNTRCSPRHLINGHHEYEHFPISSCGNFKNGKKFPFLQENVQAAPVSACQPLLKTVSATGLQNSRSKLYDSACALSLLSPPEVHSLHVNVCQDAASGDRIPLGQPLISAMQCGGLGRFYGSQALNSVSPTGFLCSRNEHEHVGTVLVSDNSDDLQFHSSFHVGGEGSSDGTPQTLSSSWQ